MFISSEKNISLQVLWLIHYQQAPRLKPNFMKFFEQDKAYNRLDITSASRIDVSHIFTWNYAYVTNYIYF